MPGQTRGPVSPFTGGRADLRLCDCDFCDFCDRLPKLCYQLVVARSQKSQKSQSQTPRARAAMG